MRVARHAALFLLLLPYGDLVQFLAQLAAFIVPELLGEAAQEIVLRVVRAALA